MSPERALTCRQLVMLISDYLESALPDADRTRFDAHIAGCAACAAYLQQLRLTIRTVGRLREDDLPDAVRKPLLTAFRDWHKRTAS